MCQNVITNYCKLLLFCVFVRLFPDFLLICCLAKGTVINWFYYLQGTTKIVFHHNQCTFIHITLKPGSHNAFVVHGYLFCYFIRVFTVMLIHNETVMCVCKIFTKYKVRRNSCYGKVFYCSLIMFTLMCIYGYNSA